MVISGSRLALIIVTKDIYIYFFLALVLLHKCLFFSYQIGQTDTKGNDNYKSTNEHLQTILKKIPIIFVITMKIALPNYILLSEIPIYGVLTYADKQQLNDLQYVHCQTQFRNRLGLIDTRFKCIANYCAAVDPTGSYISTTLPELDIPVLELMTQVSLQ